MLILELIEKFREFSSNYSTRWMVSINLLTLKLSWLLIELILWIPPFSDLVV